MKCQNVIQIIGNQATPASISALFQNANGGHIIQNKCRYNLTNTTSTPLHMVLLHKIVYNEYNWVLHSVVYKVCNYITHVITSFCVAYYILNHNLQKHLDFSDIGDRCLVDWKNNNQQIL